MIVFCSLSSFHPLTLCLIKNPTLFAYWHRSTTAGKKWWLSQLIAARTKPADCITKSELDSKALGSAKQKLSILKKRSTFPRLSCTLCSPQQWTPGSRQFSYVSSKCCLRWEHGQCSQKPPETAAGDLHTMWDQIKCRSLVRLKKSYSYSSSEQDWILFFRSWLPFPAFMPLVGLICGWGSRGAGGLGQTLVGLFLFFCCEKKQSLGLKAKSWILPKAVLSLLSA